MVLSVGVAYEGEETFALVEKIRNMAAKYYGNNYYLAGQGVSTYDLMDTITDDIGESKSGGNCRCAYCADSYHASDKNTDCFGACD